MQVFLAQVAWEHLSFPPEAAGCERGAVAFVTTDVSLHEKAAFGLHQGSPLSDANTEAIFHLLACNNLGHLQCFQTLKGPPTNTV